MKSWKTTLMGIGGLITAAWLNIGAPLFDSIDTTNPDITAFIAAATVAVGLIFARDNNVSSEQVGAGNTGAK